MAIYKKLAEVKKALDGKVVKNMSANMGKFKYSFINLEKLLDLVEPELEKQGLYLYFPSKVVDYTTSQGCVISCLDTENNYPNFIDSWCEVCISKNTSEKSGDTKYGTHEKTILETSDFQETGKQMTYLRRYLLLGLLGLQASEDDDGAKSRGGTFEKRSKTPPKTNELVSQAKAVDDKERFKIFLHAKAAELRGLGPADKEAFTKVLDARCKEFGLKKADCVNLIKGK